MLESLLVFAKHCLHVPTLTVSSFLFSLPEICQFGFVSYLVADLLNSCDQLLIAYTELG